MARWISYSLPIFLGILALAATVDTDDGVDDSSKDLGAYRKISTSQGSKQKADSGSSNKKKKPKKKKKTKKKKVKHHDDRPATSSQSQRLPYKGTGGLTSETWKAAFWAGSVYRGPEYMESSGYKEKPDEMPTICENWNLTSPVLGDNDTAPVLFYCPGYMDTPKMDHCCGEVGEEYCCTRDSPNAVLIISILSALVVVAVIIFGCCVWKKIHQKSELDKQPADQVVVANMSDPMLPPTIVTPPPPQTAPETQGTEMEQQSGETKDIPAVDESGETGGTDDLVKQTEVEDKVPAASPQKDIIITFPNAEVNGPPPEPV